jgi:hypothetical protein
LGLALATASCGVDPSTSGLKIVGGQKVRPAITVDGKNPKATKSPANYTVQLTDTSGQRLCSGTVVLDGTYVVTASHCIDHVTGITFVIFDQVDSNTKTKQKHRIVTTIQGYGVINPGFVKRSRQEAGKTDGPSSLKSLFQLGGNQPIPTGDIALVKLFAEPKDIPEYITPLEWAKKGMRLAKGATIRSSGYGKTMKPSQGKEVSSQANKLVIQSAIEQAKGLKAGPEKLRLEQLIQTHLDELHKLSAENAGSLHTVELKLESIQRRDAELIATSPDNEWKSVCYGDSGGPSVILDEGKLVLVGVNARIGKRRCIDESKLADIRIYTNWLEKFALDQAQKAAEFFIERNQLELDGESSFIIVQKQRLAGRK